MAFLIDKVRAEGIPVVFTIELSNGKLADTICEATGAKKLEFATCHNVTAQAFADGATYLQLMERNVQALREALNSRWHLVRVNTSASATTGRRCCAM